jgi:ATP-dependent Clp protease ATP-binding subunit ClpB
MRFDRFTIRGQEAIQNAIGVAEKNENQQVEPEHLLVSMFEQENGVVNPILGKIGVNRQKIKQELEVIIEKYPKVKGGQQSFSSRINTIFAEAQKEAERMQDEYIST